MKKLVILIGLVSLLFFSCDFLGELFNSPETTGSTRNFWAFDFKTNRNYRTSAELLFEGKYCNVWVEKSSKATKTHAQQFANEYDNKIYHQLIDAFSLKNFDFNGELFTDVMDFADWLTDGDGKLCILLLDIRDNFHRGVNDSYVAGYFWAGDFFAGAESNRRAIIYIDVMPGLERVDEAYSTIAHEMQHLMNFITSIHTRYETIDDIRYYELMDTWIDEGLSGAAEYIYAGHSTSRVDWFNSNGDDRGLIDQGNNFFVWGNRRDESIYAVLDDYSTVYLFFQWLRLQAGNNANIYREIITSEFPDHRSVTSAMNNKIPSLGYSQWDVLLKTWLAANYINAESGPYGYMNDNLLKTIRVPSPSSITNLIELAPGEGVYSFAGTNPNPVGQGINIKNAYLTNTLTDTYQTSSTMLTYNINIDPEAVSEFGVTTGVPVPAASTASAGRSIMSGFSGPYRISAGDFFRQHNRMQME